MLTGWPSSCSREAAQHGLGAAGQRRVELGVRLVRHLDLVGRDLQIRERRQDARIGARTRSGLGRLRGQKADSRLAATSSLAPAARPLRRIASPLPPDDCPGRPARRSPELAHRRGRSRPSTVTPSLTSSVSRNETPHHGCLRLRQHGRRTAAYTVRPRGGARWRHADEASRGARPTTPGASSIWSSPIWRTRACTRSSGRAAIPAHRRARCCGRWASSRPPRATARSSAASAPTWHEIRAAVFGRTESAERGERDALSHSETVSRAAQRVSWQETRSLIQREECR